MDIAQSIKKTEEGKFPYDVEYLSSSGNTSPPSYNGITGSW